jgi:hypothetical protein
MDATSRVEILLLRAAVRRALDVTFDVVRRARRSALLVLVEQVTLDVVRRASGASLLVLLEQVTLDVVRGASRHWCAPFGLFRPPSVRSLPAY